MSPTSHRPPPEPIYGLSLLLAWLFVASLTLVSISDLYQASVHPSANSGEPWWALLGVVGFWGMGLTVGTVELIQYVRQGHHWTLLWALRAKITRATPPAGVRTEPSAAPAAHQDSHRAIRVMWTFVLIWVVTMGVAAIILPPTIGWLVATLINVYAPGQGDQHWHQIVTGTHLLAVGLGGWAAGHWLHTTPLLADSAAVPNAQNDMDSSKEH